jgi:hypothetical protein
VEKIVCIIFIAAVLIAGCAAESTVPPDQIWPEDKYMTRLEREVDELCTNLIEGITPGSMYITWQDNLHPHSPLLAEAYVVSMFKRKLAARGYTITTQEQDAEFMLSLIMTPHEKSLLALASIKNHDMVIATREAYFTKGSEKWNRALSSYRYRSKTRISLGSNP